VNAFRASANADTFNNVERIIFQKIISAHQLASPTLAGVSGSGNLSGNANEIINAYILYNYTVIEKMRGKILDHLNKFTKLNKTAPLVIEELDVIAKIRNTTITAATETPENEEDDATKLQKKAKMSLKKEHQNGNCFNQRRPF